MNALTTKTGGTTDASIEGARTAPAERTDKERSDQGAATRGVDGGGDPIRLPPSCLALYYLQRQEDDMHQDGDPWGVRSLLYQHAQRAVCRNDLRGYDVDDLVSEAFAELIASQGRYDQTKGKWSTFAVVIARRRWNKIGKDTRNDAIHAAAGGESAIAMGEQPSMEDRPDTSRTSGVWDTLEDLRAKLRERCRADDLRVLNAMIEHDGDARAAASDVYGSRKKARTVQRTMRRVREWSTAKRLREQLLEPVS